MMNRYDAGNLTVQSKKAQVEQTKRATEQATSNARAEQDFRDRHETLSDKLNKFIATVPVSMQVAGVPLALFVDNIRGRFKCSASAPALGKALRELGWTRTRQWRQESTGFAALWHGPATPNKRSSAAPDQLVAPTPAPSTINPTKETP